LNGVDNKEHQPDEGDAVVNRKGQDNHIHQHVEIQRCCR
jgi:hypothetical protein